MIKVHHLENSRSHRVLWLLEELGTPYEILTYRRDPMTKAAQADLRAVHPLGKSPVIEDGGIKLAETGAILEYLAETHDGAHLVPERGTVEHVRYLQWLHAAEGSVMPPLTLQLWFRRADPASPALARVDGTVRDFLDYAAAELSSRPYFAGASFSLADIQMSYPLQVAEVRGNFTPAHAVLGDFLERIAARPAYGRALERGGGLELIAK